MSAKTLRLFKKEKISDVSNLFSFQKTDSTPFEFVGGQYIILNVGFDSQEDKPIKRAYSILSSDSETSSFQICVKRLESGKASQILFHLEEGAELEYSGPWGKFVGNPDWPSYGPSFIFATDTGITTLLGLLRSKKFSAKFENTKVIWCKTEEDTFLSESKIHSFLEGISISPEIRILPSISHPDRISEALRILEETIRSVGIPTNAFFSGDGNILRVWQSELIRLGTPESQIGIEAFFHTGRTNSPGVAKV